MTTSDRWREIARRLGPRADELRLQADRLGEEFAAGDMLAPFQCCAIWAEAGLDEPNEFRHEAQVRSRFELAPQINNSFGPGPGPLPEHEPGEQGFSPGPQEPMPKNEACQNEGCDPAAESEFGPGPNAEEDHPQNDPGPDPDPQPDPGPDPEPNPDPGSGTNQNPNPGTAGNDPSKGNGGKP